MSLTYEQARDEISKQFNDAWASTGFSVFWDDIGGAPPASVTTWARFTMKHSVGTKQTLTDGTMKAVYTREGTITVQLFGPRGAGLKDLDPLSKIVGDAFDGKRTPGGAWFKNVRINEIGGSGEWYQVNVLIDFQYDEVK